MLALRQAEREAQQALRFIWSERDGKQDLVPKGLYTFEGTVIEVISGDTFKVLEDKKEGDPEYEGGTAPPDSLESREKKVTLSSIK